MKRLIFLMLAALSVASNIRAQSIGPSTINGAGGTVVIGSNTFDWSVGEMTMVSTFSGTSVIVTQGVLQPAEGITKVANTQLLQQLLVFPNPAASVVNLKYTSQSAGTINYRLMDMAGRMLIKKTIDVKQGVTVEQIDIADLANAAYLLEVTVSTVNGTSESVSYNIQKIK